MPNLFDCRFYQQSGVPGIVGVIDCTHVAIKKPPLNDPIYPENIYVNRKSYHSINVQLVMEFTPPYDL